MSYRGPIPEDVPESEPHCPDLSARLEEDELLQHLKRLGIDLDGFDHDPMEGEVAFSSWLQPMDQGAIFA